MAVGKYLSLPEARKDKLLDRFAKEHQTTGSKKGFDALLGAMAKKPPAVRQSSKSRQGDGD